MNNLLPDRTFLSNLIARSTKNPIAHFSPIRSPDQQKTPSPINQKIRSPQSTQKFDRTFLSNSIALKLATLGLTMEAEKPGF
ncbi:hypothetical protein [Microcoleus sp. Pol12B4]|uniref:hypothetical protein n=1 Tax=Microcoleus sp. Pol12B4 TaxID=3055395 RepID=UPI002FD4CE2C